MYLSSEAVHLSRLVDDDEVTAVASGERVALFFEGGFEGLGAVGSLLEGGDLLLHRGGKEASALALLPFGLVGFSSRKFRLLLAIALRVLAGHRLMPEFLF